MGFLPLSILWKIGGLCRALATPHSPCLLILVYLRRFFHLCQYFAILVVLLFSVVSSIAVFKEKGWQHYRSHPWRERKREEKRLCVCHIYYPATVFTLFRMITSDFDGSGFAVISAVISITTGEVESVPATSLREMVKL